MPVRGDIEIDVSSSPYETGFKFNTLPFGGMTIDSNNSVRIGSAGNIKLAPAAGYNILVNACLAFDLSSANRETLTSRAYSAVTLILTVDPSKLVRFFSVHD